MIRWRQHERQGSNLLFIFSDQHAQRVAGCYGDPIARTPNLDALAARGVLFDNAYCPSPICVPSRMSMLTGRFPSAQDCWTNDDHLPTDSPTMAHALGAAGYQSDPRGPRPLHGPDQLHGYAERLVGDHSPNWAGVPRHDLGPLDRTNDPWRDSIEKSGTGLSGYEVKDAATVEAAVARLRELGERHRRDDGQPFAMTVGLLLPHAPFVARVEDYALFAGRVGAPRLAAPPMEEHPWLAWWRQSRNIVDVGDDAVLRARTAYYALVHRMDAMIGEVLDALDEAGLRDDTLVVYASDHGEQLGERGLFWKHTFHDDPAKVPVIMAWPGVLAEGERRRHVVNLTDLTCTMLDAVGAPPLPRAQASSFLEVAKDGGTPWADETFCEYCTDAVPAMDRRHGGTAADDPPGVPQARPLSRLCPAALRSRRGPAGDARSRRRAALRDDPRAAVAPGARGLGSRGDREAHGRAPPRQGPAGRLGDSRATGGQLPLAA